MASLGTKDLSPVLETIIILSTCHTNGVLGVSVENWGHGGKAGGRQDMWRVLGRGVWLQLRDGRLL